MQKYVKFVFCQSVVNDITTHLHTGPLTPHDSANRWHAVSLTPLLAMYFIIKIRIIYIAELPQKFCSDFDLREVKIKVSNGYTRFSGM
jgi:hypothetical protein